MDESLIHKVDTAIAWGLPDAESIGYSSSEFIGILRELKQAYLESTIRVLELEGIIDNMLDIGDDDFD